LQKYDSFKSVAVGFLGGSNVVTAASKASLWRRYAEHWQTGWINDKEWNLKNE
jgi:hypothetical protein